MSRARIVPLRMAELQLPEWHPEGPGPCAVFAFAIVDEEGILLVDSGVGDGNPLIEKLYAPRCVPLAAALASEGLSLSGVRGVIASHLHFDHCGNNRLLPNCPIYVQAAELEAARTPHYSVPEWLALDSADYRVVSGDCALSDHVSLIASAGHTPGHQSVRVEGEAGTELVVAQAVYDAEAFAKEDSAVARRLRKLAPARAYFSHDPRVWEAS